MNTKIITCKLCKGHGSLAIESYWLEGKIKTPKNSFCVDCPKYNGSGNRVVE